MKEEVIDLPNNGDTASDEDDPFYRGSVDDPTSSSRSTGNATPVAATSTATLATAVSNAWNSPTRFSQLSTGDYAKYPYLSDEDEATRPTVHKTTCLVCCHLILSKIEGDEPVAQKVERKVRLQKFCELMKVSGKELPDNCSKEMFPFCIGCKRLLEDLSLLKDELDGIQNKINGKLDAVLKNAVDGDKRTQAIKKPMTPEMLEVEARKFIPFRQMMRDCYQRIFKERNPEVSRVTPDVGVVPSEFNDTQATLMRAPPTAAADDDGNRPGPSSAGRSSGVIEAARKLPARPSHNSGPSSRKMHKNRENVAFVKNKGSSPIKNGQGGGGGVKRSAIPTTTNQMLLPSVVVTRLAPEVLENVKRLKREAGSATAQAEMEEYSDWDSDDDDIYLLGSTRNIKFGGAEIIKCVAPTEKEFLQCSICSFTVPFTKKWVRGELTPHQKVKAHIRETHNRAVLTEAGKVQPNPTPSTCNQNQDETSHPNPNDGEGIDTIFCDVCERPFKCKRAFRSNLRKHRFTHKNADERRAAVGTAEVEGVSRGSFLTKPKGKRQAGKRRKRCRFTIRKHRKSGLNNGGAGGGPSGNKIGDFKCGICGRSFPKINLLGCHMRVHNREACQKVNSPSKMGTSHASGLEVLTVKRMKKKSRIDLEKPPVLERNGSFSLTHLSRKGKTHSDYQKQKDGNASQPGTSQPMSNEIDDEDDDDDGMLPQLELKREMVRELELDFD